MQPWLPETALTAAGLTALAAQDASDKQITCVKAPFKSLIDHVFISPNLVPCDHDFMILALDRTIERFQEVSIIARSSCDWPGLSVSVRSRTRLHGIPTAAHRSWPPGKVKGQPSHRRRPRRAAIIERGRNSG
ncbi:hypothetical protein [Mesorhizobium sp. 113-1-2]|uniref:hypothetical protein n=1 Tax=Mesorhizobium sp. 113-1-2 TaxID=2744515 RepID=UPI001926A960|nr:hypothetical protein [Mesorhizobium sp. 113-1-2]